MDFDIIIKNGVCVNQDREFKSDVGIKDGIITSLEANIDSKKGKTVIDATDKFIFPGGIDPHVHLEMPFMGTVSSDDYFTGSKAAIAGGTTMYMDFCIPKTKGGSLVEAFLDAKKRMEEKSCCDYGIHMGLNSWDEKREEEMSELVNKHGINSFKFFTAYKGALMINDSEIMKVLSFAKKLGAVAQVHCENGDMVEKGQMEYLKMGKGKEVSSHALSRPSICESEATGRVLKMAEFIGCPIYIVHVMSADAMDEINKAKLRGQRVIGESLACAVVLDSESTYFNDKLSWEEKVKFVMSPPIRSSDDSKRIKFGIKNKVIDLIGTDHCTFKLEQRKMGLENFTKIPNGMNGIEDRMNILYEQMINKTGLITRSDFVRLTSSECAQIFNFYPQKGALMIGSDADIIIFNPKKEKTISLKNSHQNLDYNVFEGFKCAGSVETTIVNGAILFINDDFTFKTKNDLLNMLPNKKNHPKFISNPPFGKLFQGLDKQNKNFGHLN